MSLHNLMFTSAQIKWGTDLKKKLFCTHRYDQYWMLQRAKVKKNDTIGFFFWISRMIADNDKYLRRSLSRERISAEQTNKTYITISSGGKATRIRESSPSKKDILNKYCSPLKSTEIFKDLVDKPSGDDKDEDDESIGEEEVNVEKQSERKISFTTEKTILINNHSNTDVNQQANIRKVSIDINYVYEQGWIEFTHRKIYTSTSN